MESTPYDRDYEGKLRISGIQNKRRQDRIRTLRLFEEFIQEFPDEESCMESLLKKLSWRRCRSCNSAELSRLAGSRSVVCTECGVAFSLTAGTFFHGIANARPWWAAIWLLGRGADLNPHQLHLMVGVAYSTASILMKKIWFAIHQVMMESPGIQQENSASFMEIFRRRSLESPSRQAPRGEEEAAQAADPNPNSSPCDVAFNLDEPQRRLLRLLSDVAQGSERLSDQAGLSIGDTAANLTILELEGLASRISADGFARTGLGKRAALSLISEELAVESEIAEQRNSDFIGDKPRGSEPQIGPELAGILPAEQVASGTDSLDADPGESLDMLGEKDLKSNNCRFVLQFMEYILCSFDGIARKYLQIYLAVFWCRSDRLRWDIDAICGACYSRGRIRLVDILRYVTPLRVVLRPESSLADC